MYKIYVLWIPLPTRDVLNIILLPIIIFTDFLDICHKQMLMYDNSIFGQLSFKQCVNYKLCLNSLRTALV